MELHDVLVAACSEDIISIDSKYLDFLRENYHAGYTCNNIACNNITIFYMFDTKESWFNPETRNLFLGNCFYNNPVNIYDSTCFKNPEDFIKNKDDIIIALADLRKAYYISLSLSDARFETVVEKLFISSKLIKFMCDKLLGKFISSNGYTIEYEAKGHARYINSDKRFVINSSFQGAPRDLTKDFWWLKNYINDKIHIQKALKELREAYEAEPPELPGWTKI